MPYAKRSYQKSGYYTMRRSDNRKKHSGARTGKDKNGNPFVSGWNDSRSRGLVSFFAAPYKKTKVVHSRNGREYHTWILKITSNKDFQTRIAACLYDPAKQRITCPDYNL